MFREGFGVLGFLGFGVDRNPRARGITRVEAIDGTSPAEGPEASPEANRTERAARSERERRARA